MQDIVRQLVQQKISSTIEANSIKFEYRGVPTTIRLTSSGRYILNVGTWDPRDPRQNYCGAASGSAQKLVQLVLKTQLLEAPKKRFVQLLQQQGIPGTIEGDCIRTDRARFQFTLEALDEPYQGQIQLGTTSRRWRLEGDYELALASMIDFHCGSRLLEELVPEITDELNACRARIEQLLHHHQIQRKFELSVRPSPLAKSGLEGRIDSICSSTWDLGRGFERAVRHIIGEQLVQEYDQDEYGLIPAPLARQAARWWAQHLTRNQKRFEQLLSERLQQEILYPFGVRLRVDYDPEGPLLESLQQIGGGGLPIKTRMTIYPDRITVGSTLDFYSDQDQVVST